MKKKIVLKKWNRVLAEKAEVADSLFSRFKGLMFLEHMKGFDGMLIKRCNSIHTCFMKFDIDVLFLDANFKVVKIVRRMKPWRITRIFFKASQVLELPGGTLPAEVDENEFLEVLCSN